MALDDYDIIATPPIDLTSPSFVEYTPVITQDDIDKTYITRYFVRQSNFKKGEIVEISENDSITLRGNTMWTVVSLLWRIAGPLDDIPGPEHINSPTLLYTGVLTANTKALAAADAVMPEMVNKLPNNAQYYHFDDPINHV